MKKIISISLVLIIIILTFVFSNKTNYNETNLVDRDVLLNHDFTEIDFAEVTGNIINYTEYKNNYLNTANNYVISFDSAEELYNWSVDVSFHRGLSNSEKEHLMNKNYTLGRDIDYGLMRSRRFIPIGYNFSLISNTNINYSLEFNGIFDGRGFEISNLYLAGYDELIYIDNIAGVTEDIAISNYHAMFNHNNGIIKNIGLINPTIDLEYEHPDIYNFANLVGENNNIVENIYLIERRNLENGGMRVVATASQSDQVQKSAAALVHTNNYLFKNSYYAGLSVVNQGYVFPFDVEALVYNNTSTIESTNLTNLVYDNTLYLEEIDLGIINKEIGTPTYGVGVSTSALYNGTSQLASNWHYYPQDRYPSLFGLTYSSGNYLISNAVDMLTFNKLQNMSTVKNGLAFRASNYLVTNDINFADIAKDAYKPSTVEFSGIFDGGEHWISNLSLVDGVIIGTGYYSAMFAIVSGTIKNIVLNNSNITPSGYDDFYGQHFYISNLVGRLDGGVINNVYIDGFINLGTGTIGSFSVGGVVGEASGEVIKVYHEGLIDLGTHQYDNEIVSNNLNVGGIVGRISDKKLTMYNVLNRANIRTYSADQLRTQNTNQPNLNVGGVIGFVENGINRTSNLGLMTNEGTITIRQITNSSNVTIHLGGVIGYSSGTTYLNNAFQGLFENKGNFNLDNTNSNIKAAGILVSDHSQTITFNQLFNTNDILVNSSNINAATLIYNIGNSININQAHSSGNYNLEVINKNISLAIYNEKSNIETNLRYIEVKTNLDITANNTSETSYAGITLSNNTNYYNITYNGVINVRDNSNSSNPLWVAGIAKELTSGYIMKDSLSKGSINVVARKASNIYIAGLVNRNLSGDLHNQDNNARPRATLGIINSINQADITSTISGESNYGITGLANVFAGGVTTFNSGSIQDVVNIGNIFIANLDTYVSSRVSVDNSEMSGGMTNSFRSGIVIGGVAATVSNGYSRIYDTSNSGSVIGISEHYVRSGGVLGQSLLIELNAAFVNSNLYSDVSDVSSNQYISNSILSNGINYGFVSAVTRTIASYSTSNSTQSQQIYVNNNNQDVTPSLVGSSLSMRSTVGTVERIGVYSSAGGVIGYGLSKMYRMLNHGEISATDAAGGIVGATFVYASNFQNVVHINTAINYGDIRAINNGNYGNINKQNVTQSINTIRNYYYSLNHTFIIPDRANSNPDIRRHPQSKRGFGGIFGRIKRGGNQVMTSEGGSFDFIVNMNPNIDLIGRLDQNYNFSWSGTAFRFYGAKYYSAKPDDTTQAVFTGFHYTDTFNITNRNTSNRYVVTEKDIQYEYRNNNREYRSRTVTTTYTSTSTNTSSNYFTIRETRHQIGQRSTLVSSEITRTPSSSYYSSTTTTSSWSSWQTNPGGEKPGKTVEFSSHTVRNRSYAFLDVVDVPHITESLTPVNNNSFNVYNEAFEMRDDNTILTTGEPITSYIYYAENNLLADRFKTERANGMYVLSTSSGSNFGSVLPRNVNINNFRTLTRDIPLTTNYENITNNTYFNEVDNDLMNGYINLYQTKFNDRSDLLEVDQVFEMKEQGQSELLLQDPVINYDNRTITFDLYIPMLNGQSTINFDILRAVLPSNALITRLPTSNESNSQFQQLLINNTDTNGIATDMLKPNLSINNVPTTTTNNVLLGRIRSYSEAAINDQNFVSSYYTEYDIYINFIQSLTLPSFGGVRANSTGTWQTTPWSNNNLNVNNTVNTNLEFRIRDSANNHFSSSYTMKDLIELSYLDGSTYVLVDKEYYDIISSPKDANRYIYSTVVMGDKLRDGTYRVTYKYFPQGVENNLTFNYTSIRDNRILDLRMVTGSYYNETETINGDLAFGYSLPIGTINVLDTNYEVIDSNALPYLNNKSYSFPFMEYLTVTDYFEINNLDISSTELSNGYIQYDLVFNLVGGQSITKTFVEATISPTYFKDGVRIPNGTTSITREAELSIIEIDFNLLDSINPLFTANSFITNFDNRDYISKSYENGVLRFVFDQQLIYGEYNTNVTISLNGRTINNVASLAITKNRGINAYLSDLRFSNIPQETSYPNIYISNENGVILNPQPYELDIYFAGIDYNGADVAGFKNFRIDGEVSHIALDEYTPIMEPYLPIGAKIELKRYNSDGTFYFDSNLLADFTVDPKTGLPPTSDDEDIIITYLVTSEDNQNKVYYHITVSDADYNVTLVFNIYYKDTNNNYHPIVYGSNTPLSNETLTISILNYDVALNGNKVNIGSTPITNINNYLNFNEITAIRTEVHMFYASYIDNIIYRFGRNVSGFYQVKLNIPENYRYDIYTGSSINEITQANKLNYFSSYTKGSNLLDDGYYYYINGSTRLRVRYFNIVISDEVIDNKWGLTDSN